MILYYEHESWSWSIDFWKISFKYALFLSFFYTLFLVFSKLILQWFFENSSTNFDLYLNFSTSLTVPDGNVKSISTCYLISLALALLSKTTHENIGFEKPIYQSIAPKGPIFILGFCFLNIVWEFLEIDFRWKIRDFLKKNLQQIIFCWRFSKPFFLWMDRLPHSQGNQGFYKKVNTRSIVL